MGDKATDSLQKLMSSSVLIILLWLLIWPSAVQKFEYYKDARDLHAWLFLQDRVKNIDWNYVFSQGTYDEISEDCHPSTEPFPICVPLQIDVIWPIASTFDLTLKPKLTIGNRQGGYAVEIYSVEVKTDELPFLDYEVVSLQTGEAWVVPVNLSELYEKLKPDSLRLQSIAAKEYARPIHWDSISVSLAKHGFRQHPFNLEIDNAALGKLDAEADPRNLTVQVFGIPLSLGLFISAVGLLLGANAFGMIGPLIALHRAKPESLTTPWIMVVQTERKGLNTLLEILLWTISIVWIAAPLTLLALQLTTEIEIQQFERIALRAGIVGLIFSSFVHLITVLELYAYRRNKSSRNKRQPSIRS